MLNAEEIQQLLSVTWVKAQEETGETLPRLKIASTHYCGVFGLDKLPQHEVAQRTHQKYFRGSEITEIIFCKYFSTLKQQGNCNESFFDAINEVFICLVTSAMRHCLKAWMTRVYVEPPSATKFKYYSTIRCLELDQPIEVGDTSAFEAELMQELLQATRAARITWQRIPDAFHQQVDQREEEDHSQKANSNSHMETDVEAAEHETDNELEEETDDN
ncbi:hypothetical protein BGX38DRAFT_1145356 [Terfezia claveryi]|nr:hypothetical protein BGX38DRAFT_1145356 [Terfezia claveryi]